MIKPHWEIDHVCYRTKSIEHYNETKDRFATQGKLLIESQVGGRPIATYKLSKPVIVSNFIIDLVEAPAPKPGREIDEGYEHLEIVIDCDFNDLMERYPEIDWNTRALTKELNPELEANFDGFNVKFHHHSLEQIINIEKDSRVNDFLIETNFLKKYASFRPLISGTIPLAIHTNESDLDILLETSDFDLLAKDLKDHFHNSRIKILDHYLLANIKYNDLNIELYAEKTSVLKQNSHRHLRIEARLLKVLGEHFVRDIKKLKELGVKTEPAFGQLLGLSSPYEDLLALSSLSDFQLMQRFSALYVM